MVHCTVQKRFLGLGSPGFGFLRLKGVYLQGLELLGLWGWDLWL